MHSMKKILRSYYFWVLFVTFSLVSIVVALNLNPLAFPIVHINLTMDKDEALKEAERLSERYQLGPSSFKSAASFETDSYFNTFVELEGGGK
ncbi:MAG TPA: hypothetical protein VEK06_03755, partial [Myxococcota bacterium]|nr:hypothetical protein [Myxococcota bacterium]